MKISKKFYLLAALVLIFSGCDDTVTEDGPSVSIGKSLTTYASCDDLTDALEAITIVNQGIDYEDTGIAGAEPVDASAEGDSSNERVINETAAATDVQEADIVKAEGNYLYLLHQSGKLIIYDATDKNSIEKTGEVEVGDYPTEMVIEGNLAVVIGYPSSEDYSEGGEYYGTIVSMVDVTDKIAPTLIRKIRLNGSYVDSRLIGSYMHIVTSFSDYFETSKHPTPSDMTQKILKTTYSGDTSVDTEEETPCANIYLPTVMRFDGYGNYYYMYTTQVATLDLTDQDSDVTSNVVLAAYPTVSASPNRLLLADWDWEYDSTALHVFDIETDPSKPSYLGAASFTGKVLDQFSMDETEGMIRVAFTTNTNSGGSDDNDNGVVLFQEGDGEFTELGFLDGVEVGESIWSARFLGDKVFLVTYETIDPLIAIDLTDPANPEVVGELEVPGVSTYLHAIDESHLLSVGLDFGEDGSTWGGGVALSLFDVTDYTTPVLSDREVIETGGGDVYSEANSTHKAFAYFPDSQIVAIPVTTYPMYYEDGVNYTSKLYVYHVDTSEGFTELAVIDHSDLIPEDDMPEWGLYGYAMRRSLVIDDAFFSVSDYAVEAHDPTDFTTPLFTDYTGVVSFDYYMPVMAE